ncbi:MAG: AI-2E family transporter [Nitrospirae bacterium]|nr:MAG: AI-2E family transporter [Nitrospirota bacterium]
MERKGTNILLMLASFVVVVAGMRVAAPLLVPLLLAMFISIIVAPPLFWLKSKKVPVVVGILIVIVVIVIFVVLIAAMVGSSIESFSNNLPLYQTRLEEKGRVVLSLLGKLGVNISPEKLLEVFNPSLAMGLVTKMLTGLGGVLTNGFLIIFTIIFILLEAADFPDKLRRVLKDPEKSMPYFRSFVDNIQRYMAIKTLISLGTGLAVAIWLLILSVDFALLWGVFAFLLNYIPNIGSILAAVPAVLLAYIQFGAGKAVLVASGYLVINLVAGNVVEPRVMGRGLGLSTLVVFLSLIFWGWVFGPVGMLLSVPLTMTLKLALQSREDTRWMAMLLGTSNAENHDLVRND